MNKTKVCKKCGEEKEITLFVKSKNCKDGYENKCKECNKKYKKKYYQENKEEINKHSKQYYEENKEGIKQRSKQYRKENKEHCQEYSKQYRKENKEKITECKKQHYKENKEIYQERSKQYRKENKEHCQEYNKQYYKENKEELLEYQRQYNKENPHVSFNSNIRRRSKIEQQGKGITKGQWFEMMNFFDWKCAYSNESLKNTKDTYGRTIDHIVALENGGLNEPWNCIPMRKGYNSSKNDKVNSLDWYKKQDYYSEDRLNKIIEWQIYAYEKWATEDDEDLILIVDIK